MPRRAPCLNKVPQESYYHAAMKKAADLGIVFSEERDSPAMKLYAKRMCRPDCHTHGVPQRVYDCYNVNLDSDFRNYVKLSKVGPIGAVIQTLLYLYCTNWHGLQSLANNPDVQEKAVAYGDNPCTFKRAGTKMKLVGVKGLPKELFDIT